MYVHKTLHISEEDPAYLRRRPRLSQKKTLPISEEDPAYLRRRPCISQKKTLHISEEDPAYLRRRPCLSQKKTLHISEEDPAYLRRRPCISQKSITINMESPASFLSTYSMQKQTYLNSLCQNCSRAFPQYVFKQSNIYCILQCIEQYISTLQSDIYTFLHHVVTLSRPH